MATAAPTPLARAHAPVSLNFSACTTREASSLLRRGLVARQLRRRLLHMYERHADYSAQHFLAAKRHDLRLVTANAYREDVADLDLVVVAPGPRVGARGGQRLVAEAAGQGDVSAERAHLRGADGLRVGGVEGAPALADTSSASPIMILAASCACSAGGSATVY
jgi:hypothetical protein